MSTTLLIPPDSTDGRVTTLVANGTTYSSTQGVPVSAGAADASVLLANGWQYFQGVCSNTPFIASPGNPKTFQVFDGFAVTVQGDVNSTGSILRVGDGSVWAISQGGPITIAAVQGIQTYVVTSTAGNISIVVQSGDSQMAPSVPGNYLALNRLASVPVLPFGHLPDGTYLCSDGPNGDFVRKLYAYDGDITQAPAGGTITAINTWNFSISNGVNCPKSADGTINMGGSGTTIRIAKVLNSGAILVGSGGATAATLVAGGAAGNYSSNLMFWRASPTSATKYALGNDLNGTNGRAVLNLGASDGLSNTMVQNVRILHQRSVCEAKVQDPKGSPYVYKVLVAEYNVNGSRTPGGANDAVRLWQSLDDGLTWSALLTFNTNGTHLINHMHAVIQDPSSGLIYILTGDNDAPTETTSQNAIIVWDGVSAAPVANSTFAQIAATPGWNCIYGSELNRCGDLVFGEQFVFGLLDCDNEKTIGWNDAYSSITMDKKLAWLSAGNRLERQDDIPPLIGVTLRKESRRNIKATAASATITCWSHRLLSKQQVYVTSSGAIPSPLQANTPYYFISTGVDTGTLRATPTGPDIVMADAGSGNVGIVIDKGAKGGFVYGSLRTQGTATVNEPYHHFWTSPNGSDWAYAARTRNYNTGQTSSIRNFWQDKAGNLIGAASYAEGMDFISGTAHSGSCVVMQAVRTANPPAVNTYD
jgi:hypothetical protein